MPLNADDIAKRYPIHWLVWNNEHEELKNLLEANKFTKEDIELRDPRGRTPLLLAVTLGYIEAVQALIDAGADVNCEKDGWTAVQEATATGDPQLLSLVLSRRDKQRHLARSSGVPDLLRRLSLAPDFYVEMKWEFTSWVPLVSRICPFDTYKVYKRGANVRVDTTLAGFDESHWQRGERTYIFRGQGTRASLVELDHELGTAWSEHMEADVPCDWPPPPRAALQQRLAAPLALNYLDTDKISFERSVPRPAPLALNYLDSDKIGFESDSAPPRAALQQRLGAPLNYLDTDKIGFEKSVTPPRPAPRCSSASARRSTTSTPIISASRGECPRLAPRLAAQEQCLASPLALNYLDTDKIGFEKSVTPPRPATRCSSASARRSTTSTPIISASRGECPRLAPRLAAQEQCLASPLALNYLDTDKIGFERSVPPPRSAPRWQQRLAAPLALNYLDTDRIGFERSVPPPRSAPRCSSASPRRSRSTTSTPIGSASRGQCPRPALQQRLAAPLALNYLDTDKIGFERSVPPPRPALQQRLAAPLALHYLDTDKIGFERSVPPPRPVPRCSSASPRRSRSTTSIPIGFEKNKSGIWGWRQDKTETVNGYDCKVFSANNVELVSKSRSEHLPRSERARAAPRAPLHGLLALADRDEPAPASPVEPEQEDLPRTSRSREDLQPVTWAEYFSDEPLEKDIGRPKEITTKVQKFKATLWLCEDYPLELQEQIMPILDLMTAISSPHFAKLKDFIQMQLPAGFPVKIEIPLFHVVNARITFGNIFATEVAVPHVECIREGARLTCVVDDACFELGRGYRQLAPGLRESSGTDDEDALLQYAIQQSLMEAGTHDDQVDVWEALRGARPVSPASPASPVSPAEPPPHHGLLAAEERQLQRKRRF
ncbi:unnamed protein product [Parnassius apollo]|uniref:(apollo) hypothetical protein n=1 Tax=Parnassius apollo TaxID=110799 RepID=A0A8S3XSA7_PARAO|nr:unnamed protein product [Parnassius apollo]